MAARINIRDEVRSASQSRLDTAWEMAGCTLAELAEAIGASEKTAREYQRMVEAGTKTTRRLNDRSSKEALEALDAGMMISTLAITWGWTPKAMRNWVLTIKSPQEKPVITKLSRRAMCLPFERWGELVNHTTRGV